VKLGSGTLSFEELSEDPALELIPGPQGGHHFIVHAEATGIWPGDPKKLGEEENPVTLFEAYLENGERLDLELPAYRIGYTTGDSGDFHLPSGRILQVYEDRVSYHEKIRIIVSIRDYSGAVARDQRWIRPIECKTNENEGGVNCNEELPEGVFFDAGLPD